MRPRGKRYQKAAKAVDVAKTYSLEEAVHVLKKFPKSKTDQTVNLAVHLGIDARKADQILRGSFALPHGIGKSRRVAVFADGDEAAAANESGADAVGMDDLAERIQGGWTDFDVCIASQRSMKVVGRLGKVLGPKGLMPSPKNGTIVTTADAMRVTVREFKAGRVEYRNDANGNIHIPVGKLSFEEAKLRDNVEAFLEHIRKSRPTTIRGQYILNASLAPSASPAVRLAVSGGTAG